MNTIRCRKLRKELTDERDRVVDGSVLQSITVFGKKKYVKQSTCAGLDESQAISGSGRSSWAT